MKTTLKFAVYVLLFGLLFHLSCKKVKPSESSNNNVSEAATNKFPIANSGPDQTIILPTDSTKLDGSSSNDPDGTISSFQWTKIAGPASFDISNATSIKTVVKNLTAGAYQFELKVTDNGGLFSKDTMQVTVNDVQTYTCPLLIPFGNLSVARGGPLTATAGSKILFIGGEENGQSGEDHHSSRVDIYDTLTHSWSIAELSQARSQMTVVSNGNKIFIAGGSLNDVYETSRVDIYDAFSNTWATAEMSVARRSLAAAAIGNKIFFAGGINYGESLGLLDIVDIYDISTNTWSTAHLSERKYILSGISLNSKVYFAGGRVRVNNNTYTSSSIDIYDEQTNSWATTNLAEPKENLAGIAVGNKLFWAGGNTYNIPPYSSNKVDIFDVNTGLHTMHQLSNPIFGQWSNVVRTENKIIFFTGVNTFKLDIYDLNAQTWSVCELSDELPISAMVAIGDQIYVAGVWSNGNYINQVWKLEF